MKHLIRAKGGSCERRVLISKLRIPDLWKITSLDSGNQIDARDVTQIRECWALCHDMLRQLKEAKE
jgi:hypothetical protein